MSQSEGDILAEDNNFFVSCRVDFAYRTWLNEPVSEETQTEVKKKKEKIEGC